MTEAETLHRRRRQRCCRSRRLSRLRQQLSATDAGEFIDHIAYLGDLVGIDHVGLGIDYYGAQHPVMPDEQALAWYQDQLSNGRWRTGTYPPPPHYYPAGIETPRTFSNLTARLLQRGFAAGDVKKILGENWLRVYRAVWGI